MKKIIISLALLGTFSLGTMAFISHDNDEPPTRRTEQQYYRHGGHGCQDGHYRHHRRGGCCGDYRRNDDRRGYGCCDERYDCGACRYDRCTVRDCHERGELCKECAEWHGKHHGDDVYKRNDKR